MSESVTDRNYWLWETGRQSR